MSYKVMRVWNKDEPELCEIFKDRESAVSYILKESAIDYFHDYYIMESLGEIEISPDVSWGFMPADDKVSKQAYYEGFCLLSASAALALGYIDRAIKDLNSSNPDLTIDNIIQHLQVGHDSALKAFNEAFDKTETK